jgi:hypothetical protein
MKMRGPGFNLGIYGRNLTITLHLDLANGYVTGFCEKPDNGTENWLPVGGVLQKRYR